MKRIMRRYLRVPRLLIALVLAVTVVGAAVAAWPATAMAAGIVGVKVAATKLLFAFPAPVVPKNKKGMEFRAKADELRKKLADETTPLSVEEVDEIMKGIRGYEARANAVEEITPDGEIDRQDGPGTADELRRANPESDDANADSRSYRKAMERLVRKVEDVFGGPNAYLRELGRRTQDSIGEKKEALIREVQDTAKKFRAIVGTTDDPSGGEYLLPLQQVQSIFQVTNDTLGLVQHATRFPVSGRTLRIPYVVQDQITDASGNLIDRPLAGIANVSIIGEGDEKPEREPRFLQRLLTVYKVAAYSEIGDETLGDDFTGDLAPTLQRLVGGQTLNRINEYITKDGTGTSMPLAGLNSNNGALISVERQTLDQITSDDVFNMYAKHTFGGGQSFWLIHRTAIPQLFALKLSGNTLVTFINNLQGVPQMMLLGLPIYMTDLTDILGSDGDLALINGGFYALAIRQALTVESSIHYKFRSDLTAYRFITRAGGIPIPTAPYAYKAAGETHTGASKPAARIAEHSPFVQLAHAATGS